MKHGKYDFLIACFAMAALLAAIFAGSLVASFFEARAFNRATGKSVSAWDAMWIELRVQEGAK